ncbi:MAG: class I mannose-6-phosphate isomerase [Bacteroidales bacterium]|jgi:mannose-6-phosphate isomerase|nr:class I mannose-6-phosphate isomerase [Bacteroidales bacterium]
MNSQLYPLKFRPQFYEKIWGGHRIKTLLGKDFTPLANCGESWEISGIDGCASVVENGFLAGNELTELIEIYMGDLVGDSVYDRFGLGFPLLIKFIDAADTLSVQVHPSDALAQQLFHENGKSELWYVLDASPDAGLYVGFQQGVTPADYDKAVEAGSVAQLLQFYPVQKGDTFFIPAGTVHAIGKGVLLAEIQQASDLTFRIFDWNRVANDGKPRTLHLKEARQALDFTPRQSYKIDCQPELNNSYKVLRESCFNVNLLTFDKPVQKIYTPIDSFVIYLCTEGHFHLFGDNIEETLEAGETLLVPAEVTELNLIPCHHKATILEVFLG